MGTSKTPEDLYDTIATFDVRPVNLEQIRQWPFDRLTQFARAILANTPPAPHVAPSTFNFVASGQLSGLPTPCAGLACRTAAVDDLARFAALYADHVAVQPLTPVIQSFLLPLRKSAPSKKNGRVRTARSRKTLDDEALDRFRRALSDNVTVLFALKPLVISGLVSFSDFDRHICPTCIRTTLEQGKMPLPARRAISTWDKSTESMIKYVNGDLLSSSKFTLRQDKIGHLVEVTNAEKYFDHEMLRFRLGTHPPGAIGDNLGPEGRQLKNDEVLALGLTGQHVRDVVDDLNSQHYFATKQRFNYITRRAADTELLQTQAHAHTRLSAAAFAALSHPLVYLDGASVDTLLSIRQRDGLSFQAYREAITKIVTETKLESARQAREAIDDLVRPEITKIEVSLKRARQTTLKSLAQDVIVTAGVVSIGVFSGLVPETMQAIATATGGVLGAKSIASQVLNAFAKPQSVTDSQFSFLWRAKRRAVR